MIINAAKKISRHNHQHKKNKLQIFSRSIFHIEKLTLIFIDYVFLTTRKYFAK
jgi:hypothetical protein